MRASSVSMSPSVRSRTAHLRLRPSPRAGVPRAPAQVAEDLREQPRVGLRQHVAEVRAPGRPPRAGAPSSGSPPAGARRGSAARAAKRAMVVRLAHARRARATAGRRSRLERSAAGERKSRSALRQKMRVEGREAVPFHRLHQRVVEVARGRRSGRRSRPSRGARPGPRSARPRPGRRGRGPRPSNLARPVNATWSMSRFRPMPMASVATR